MGNTTATKPAFIGIQYYGWLAFVWIGYQHIRPAHFYTIITAVTELRIYKYCLVWRHRVRYHIGFVIHNHSLPST